MVAQKGRRFHNHFIASLTRAQTQIHVVIVYRERLIEAAQLFENALANRQTGASHGADVTRERQPVPIRRAESVAMQMPGSFHDSNCNTCVLDCSRWVYQFRSDCSDLMPVGVRQHGG